MGKSAIHIVLADTQYLTRAGLKYLLSTQPQLRVVAEAEDREELEQVISQSLPQLVIMDHRSETFGVKDVAWLRTSYPDVQLMVVTDEDDHQVLHDLLGIGVNCILTKHCGPEEIVSAVHATVRREKFYCHKVLDLILQKPAEPEESSCRPSSLSAREAEIVALVAQGLSSKDIAERLHLSLHTVHTHRKNIMKKLGIGSVSEMILFAMNAGLARAGQPS